MIKKIKTAVIPAGGWGTRFLPSTKSVPKEMFPLDGKPIILHVVEEVVKSGITNIIFVVSHNKQSIENFFSPNPEVEDYYMKLGKKEEVKNLRKISKLANFSYVYTHPPYGNGGALAAARHLLGDEAFVFVWSDELILSKKAPRIKQCLDAYYKYGKPVISAIKISDPKLRSRYGMAELKNVKGEKEIKEIVRIAEKPTLGTEPSEYATHGAYILTPEIFTALDKTKPGKNNELWLSDVINNLKKDTPLLAKIITDGHYLDCGDPLSYLYSQIDYFLNYSSYQKKDLEKLRSGVCDLKNHIS
jgi:UTP--glucose-1-phosphate uridylyltransferase